MSVILIRKTPEVLPVTSIEVVTGNSARMTIELLKGTGTVRLSQLSPVTAQTRDYVWDKEALLELAGALTQAAGLVEEEEGTGTCSSTHICGTLQWRAWH